MESCALEEIQDFVCIAMFLVYGAFANPLAFLAAGVWHLSLPLVVALSFSDEIVKAIITYLRFRSKKWIHVLIHANEIPAS